MTSFLETPEDMQWLNEVHLKHCTTPPFAVAMIDGNEDWPTTITLYRQNDVESSALTLRPDEQGTFHCNQARW